MEGSLRKANQKDFTCLDVSDVYGVINCWKISFSISCVSMNLLYSNYNKCFEESRGISTQNS